jgi:hypothetical protein
MNEQELHLSEEDQQEGGHVAAIQMFLYHFGIPFGIQTSGL